MVTDFIAAVTGFIVNVISAGGYFGIALLMAIESAAIPLPSEIIMPFAGFLAAQGRFSLFGAALAGAIGSLIGSLILYAFGYYGGRPFVEHYGKYVLFTGRDLAAAEKFFSKYGSAANFFGRVLPVIRTFISFPAGIAKSEIKKFMCYSFIGSFIWSLFLAWIGLKFGQNWAMVREKFHQFDLLVLVLAVCGLFLYVRRHWRR